MDLGGPRSFLSNKNLGVLSVRGEPVVGRDHGAELNIVTVVILLFVEVIDSILLTHFINARSACTKLSIYACLGSIFILFSHIKSVLVIFHSGILS